MYYKKSAMLLLILSQERLKQLASSWLQGTALHKLAFLVQATKPWWLVNEARVTLKKPSQKKLNVGCFHEKRIPM